MHHAPKLQLFNIHSYCRACCSALLTSAPTRIIPRFSINANLLCTSKKMAILVIFLRCSSCVHRAGSSAPGFELKWPCDDCSSIVVSSCCGCWALDVCTALFLRLSLNDKRGMLTMVYYCWQHKRRISNEAATMITFHFSSPVISTQSLALQRRTVISGVRVSSCQY